jgi:hypothetical protein
LPTDAKSDWILFFEFVLEIGHVTPDIRGSKKVDRRLAGKGNSNFQGARPV